MLDYIYYLQNMDKACEELEKNVAEFFHKTDSGEAEANEYLCYTPRYRQYFEPIKRFSEICDIFGIKILECNKNLFREKVYMLEDPAQVRWKDCFSSALNEIKSLFNDVKREAYELDKVLSPQVKRRLNEAIHCFLEECYYSSVIMSVSAIESKLLAMMKKANPEKEEELDGFTLGHLINEYLRSKEEYKQIIPEKYEPLLKLCNTYRVFSAHPKEEEITRRVATSILNLTFEFLTDKQLI